jgi:hypothetical protein
VLHDRAPLVGISAVLVPGEDLYSALLDLVAVLEGLVGDRFEILLVADRYSPDVADVVARTGGLPLRVIEGSTLSDGCDAARYDLIFVGAPDGQFDVRELNHLLEAIEQGADVAAGYRPRRADVFLRQLQRWGLNVDLDCAYELMRRAVWQRLKCEGRQTSCCAELLASARRLGFGVVEVPVSHRRPTIGAPVSGSNGWRAA